jgi:hypothetical protein
MSFFSGKETISILGNSSATKPLSHKGLRSAGNNSLDAILSDKRFKHHIPSLCLRVLVAEVVPK